MCHSAAPAGVFMSNPSHPGGDMTNKARIPSTDITGIQGALVKWYARKQFDEVPEPLGVMWHHRPMLKAYFALGGKSEKWRACDANLKSFAHMAAASMVGRGFSLALGQFAAHNKKLPLANAPEVPPGRG